MKKLYKNVHLLSLSMGLVLGILGCTYSVSEGINDKGVAQKVIFPALEDAWLDEGVYPNLENLSKIHPGVTKDDLYHLIGRPHFSEIQHAYEWDYIFKFVQPDNSVKICQYKVIFDKDMRGQTFHWLPEGCGAPATQTEPVVAPIHQETFELGADVLFVFDRAQRQDVLAQGMTELNALADKIAAYQSQGRLEVTVKGHTDRLGGEAYNYRLSHQRASTIKQVLVDYGLPASAIEAYGVGESEPRVQCTEQNQAALIECLQPDRRVTVELAVYPK